MIHLEDKEPVIGSKIKVGNVLTGPIGTIVKIQKLEKREDKVFAIPQNVEWVKGYIPESEGYHLVNTYINDTICFVCWVEFDILDIESTLQQMYNETDDSKLCMFIYSLVHVGPNYEWWESFLEKLNPDQIQCKINNLYALMVTLKPYRKKLQNFNSCVNKIVKSIREKTPESQMIESFLQWKVWTPKEIIVDENDHLASFDFYTGKEYAKDKKVIQSISLHDVRQGTHFVVSCGDVIVKVKETDYPEIERRML